MLGGTHSISSIQNLPIQDFQEAQGYNTKSLTLHQREKKSTTSKKKWPVASAAELSVAVEESELLLGSRSSNTGTDDRDCKAWPR